MRCAFGISVVNCPIGHGRNCPCARRAPDRHACICSVIWTKSSSIDIAEFPFKVDSQRPTQVPRKWQYRPHVPLPRLPLYGTRQRRTSLESGMCARYLWPTTRGCRPGSSQTRWCSTAPRPVRRRLGVYWGTTCAWCPTQRGKQSPGKLWQGWSS